VKKKLAANMPVAVGVDIGGTKIVFGIVSKKGKILFQQAVATADFPTALPMVREVSKLIKDNLRRKWQLAGIGIGAPNGNYYTGAIEYAPNLSWQGIIPLASMFKKAFKVPVVLTNDANAAALGEMIFGGARKIRDFIFITLGTGLGSGIVVDGSMVYGHDGFAGEIGHSIIISNGRSCGCGRKGCLETYCSATGIKRTILEWLGDGGESSMKQYSPESITSKTIYDEAVKGDALALKAFEFTGEILGLALANSVVYTSPKTIFLFGGLANAGKYIFEPTIRHFNGNLHNLYRNKVKILPSRLKENDAAILGAASLVWKEIAD
jgi:glucokinase